METFKRIKAKIGIRIEENMINDFSNVSDSLENEVKVWLGERLECETVREAYFRKVQKQFNPYPPRKWPIIIQAPTGSGKNYFVLNVLAPEVEKVGGRVLLLTNRVALTLQQRKEADMSNGFPSYSRRVYEKCYISGNIDIIDYQQALEYLDDTTNNTIHNVTTVVFDEVHFFTHDSTFTKSTSVILQRLIKRFFFCKRIYMNATPEEVEPIIALEEFCASINYSGFGNRMIISNTKGCREKNEETLATFVPAWDINKNRIESRDFWGVYDFLKWNGVLYPLVNTEVITKYVFEDNFDYVNLYFFYDWNTVTNYLNTKKEEKWLLFVQDKAEGRNIKTDIGPDAIFVSAKRDKKENETFQNIIEDKKFQKRVLVSTTVLYNGVSIEDEDLKHIAVDSVDRASVVQMLGRKRFLKTENKSVNLYIKVPSENVMVQRLRSVDNLGDCVARFEKEGMNFIFKSFENEYFDDKIRDLIKKVSTEAGKEPCISEYAYTRLANEGSTYKKFLELSKQGNFSIEKEFCKWFNKDFSEEMILKDPDLIDKNGEAEGDMQKEESGREREEVLNEIRSFLDLFVEESPFNVDKCEELCMGLKELWSEKWKRFSSERPDMRHKIGRVNKHNELDYSRLVPDIRNALAAFGLHYKVNQIFRKNDDRSTWLYACQCLDDDEQQAEDIE